MLGLDLLSTDPTKETCAVGDADRSAPTRQHEQDHTFSYLPKYLDHLLRDW